MKVRGRRRLSATLTALENPLRGFLYLLPVLIILLAIEAFPILYASWVSLHKKLALAPEMQWVGLDNHLAVLGNRGFWDSAWRGAVFAGGSVLVQLVLGLPLALGLNHPFRGRGLARSFLLLPYMVPAIVVALIWRWLLDGLYGVVNLLLKGAGAIEQGLAFLDSFDWAMLVVILINSWRFLPFTILVLLARLQTIDPSLYESARVEGASAVRRFWDITVPHLRGAIMLIILLRSIWMFNKFDMVWLLTQGGPLEQTTTLPVALYLKAFTGHDYGQGSAIAVQMFLLLVMFAVIVFVFFRPEREVEVE